MNFKKTLKNFLLAGTLAISAYGCGPAPTPPTVKVEGTTEKLEYYAGEEIKLQGPEETSSAALAEHQSAIKIDSSKQFFKAPQQKLKPLFNRTADGTFKGFQVMFQPEVSYDEAVNLLEQQGAQIKNQFVSQNGLIKTFGVISTYGDNQQLAETISQFNEVYMVNQTIPLQELNHIGRALSGINFVHTHTKLTGAGELALVYDAGWAEEVLDVANRTINFDGQEHFSSAHPTHVNCTVAGDGSSSSSTLENKCNSTYHYGFEEICEVYNFTVDKSLFDNLFRGAAPGSNTISANHGGCDEWCMIENPNDIQATTITAAEEGAVLMTASLGPNVRRNGSPCELMTEYVYDSVAFTLDSIVRGDLDNIPIAILFAAGNERVGHEDNRHCYLEEFEIGEEFVTMSGGPASAKNTLAIAAGALVGQCEFLLDEDGNLIPGPESILNSSEYTSFGPMSKQTIRTKPDLMNYGGGGFYGMVSCSLFGGYTFMSGTSMATPLTSGTALLISQQYKNTLNTTNNMSPQLLYAILINSADDMKAGDNHYVDYKTGWGYVDGDGAVGTAANEKKFTEGIMTREGETHVSLVEMQNKENLEMTLVWMDPAHEELVNNLRFKATSPSGIEYYPHVLDPNNPAAEATRQLDDYNNKKKIVLDMPGEKELGIWTVEVTATTLETIDQPYAVAFSHPAFATKDAKVCNQGEGEVTGEMSFIIEKCQGKLYDCETIDEPANGPTTTLLEGECYYFHNDLEPFKLEEPGDYRITASFEKKGKVHKNEDSTLAERLMHFKIK
ncbi:S8 family serine peptidase [Candidatus Woesearchaeota archaeon]|nr:S8 family serine peptidase [Candidatus Woesearchaeota archaeon]